MPCQDENNQAMEAEPIAHADDDDSVPLAKRTKLNTSQVSSMQLEPTVTMPAALPNEDEVLVQMIQQSGAKTYADVVEFCRSTGIPLSRMLRLDLMNESSAQK